MYVQVTKDREAAGCVFAYTYILWIPWFVYNVAQYS